MLIGMNVLQINHTHNTHVQCILLTLQSRYNFSGSLKSKQAEALSI